METEQEQVSKKESRANNKKKGRSFIKTVSAGVLGSAITLMVIPQTGYYENIVANQMSLALNEEVTVNEQSSNEENSLPVQNISTGTADLMDMIEEASESIVGVVNLQSQQGYGGFFQNQQGNEQEAVEAGTGSGVIFKKEGDKAFVITNHHVIEGADEIEVSLPSGDSVQAQVVGSDALTDIAVLAIDSQSVDSVITFGDSDALRPGEQVLAIGNPLGLDLSRTVTQGIISAVNRTIPVTTSVGEWDLDVLQTDAAINPGNSGGALINTRGEVIGINSLKIAQNGIEGLGFAIPSNDLIPLVEEIIEKGEISRPYLGVGLANLNEIPQGYLGELPEELTEGVVITTVEPQSAAERAGLRTGDIVTSIDEKEVKNANDLRKVLYRDLELGQNVEISLYRNGELIKVNLTLTANTSL
ncbi:S1C family serine protease [Alkalihalobacillus sp. 1P02AB]|uniref:S1C family serine protease n=1 Tax=Alkalihalobacillus sp. 1P02AB TaxID=3132260 RepID=UPI0039A6BB83